VGALPSVFVELEVNFFLLRRLLGVRVQGEEKAGKVAKLAKAEVLMLNIGSMCTGARVVAVKNDLAKLQLTSPVRRGRRYARLVALLLTCEGLSVRRCARARARRWRCRAAWTSTVRRRCCAALRCAALVLTQPHTQGA
jgi:hypothetical protein